MQQLIITPSEIDDYEFYVNELTGLTISFLRLAVDRCGYSQTLIRKRRIIIMCRAMEEVKNSIKTFLLLITRIMVNFQLEYLS